MSKCAFVACDRPATEPPARPSYCPRDWHYVSVVLAQDRYRTEKPPAPAEHGWLGQGGLPL